MPLRSVSFIKMVNLYYNFITFVTFIFINISYSSLFYPIPTVTNNFNSAHYSKIFSTMANISFRSRNN